MQRDRTADFIAAYVTQGSRVLDVGSGRGGTAVEIALKTGCTVYGVDSSTWAVGRAKARARDRGVSDRVIFLRQRAENLDFPSGYFDLVYSIKALHETKHVEALNEMHRVLKEDDGRLIIVDWVKGSIAWTFERYFNLFELEEIVRETGFVTLKSGQEGNTLFLVAGKNVYNKALYPEKKSAKWRAKAFVGAYTGTSINYIRHQARALRKIQVHHLGSFPHSLLQSSIRFPAGIRPTLGQLWIQSMSSRYFQTVAQLLPTSFARASIVFGSDWRASMRARTISSGLFLNSSHLRPVLENPLD